MKCNIERGQEGTVNVAWRVAGRHHDYFAGQNNPSGCIKSPKNRCRSCNNADEVFSDIEKRDVIFFHAELV